jgi:hypothetical protein
MNLLRYLWWPGTPKTRNQQRERSPQVRNADRIRVQPSSQMHKEAGAVLLLVKLGACLQIPFIRGRSRRIWRDECQASAKDKKEGRWETRAGGRRSHAVVGDPLQRTKRGKATNGREVWRAGHWPSCGGDDLLLKNTA